MGPIPEILFNSYFYFLKISLEGQMQTLQQEQAPGRPRTMIRKDKEVNHGG